MCKNLKYLNQFVGHKVELFYHSPTLPYASTYTYGSFNWEVTEDDLCLMDESESYSKTFVNLDEIIEITNLNDDVYSTVVDLITRDFTLSICCAEEKPKLPRCYKCGREIHTPEESIWYIKGNANFGSHYDSPGNIVSKIVNNLSFCDDCIHAFVGEITEEGDLDE